MISLAFDTETTGLPQYKLPKNHPTQPHLVQLGAILLEDGRPVETVSLIVRPEGWEIPAPMSAIHGITTEHAQRCGVPLMLVVALFTNLRANAQQLIAHNIGFDIWIMDIAIAQVGKVPASPGPDSKFCTMRESTNIVKLPPSEKMVAKNMTGHKPPSLTECVRHFFDEELAGAHDALVDVDACVRIFHAIQALRAEGKML